MRRATKGGSVPVTFDLKSLFTPVGEKAVDDYRSRLDADSFEPELSPRTLSTQAVVLFGGGLMALVLGILNLPQAHGVFTGVVVFVLALGVIFPALGAWSLARAISIARHQWPFLAARARFAAANGLTFLPSEKNPGLLGIPFLIGNDPTSYSVFTRTEGLPFEFGNYVFTRGVQGRRGVTQIPISWSYVVMTLPGVGDEPAVTPHLIVARPKSRRVFYAAGGLLESRGADSRFSVYHTPMWHGDERSVFSQELRDLAARRRLALEMVRGRVFVYRPLWWRFHRRSQWGQIEEILAALRCGVTVPNH